jgi:hypothetical protein
MSLAIAKPHTPQQLLAARVHSEGTPQLPQSVGAPASIDSQTPVGSNVAHRVSVSCPRGHSHDPITQNEASPEGTVQHPGHPADWSKQVGAAPKHSSVEKPSGRVPASTPCDSLQASKMATGANETKKIRIRIAPA